MKRLTIMLLSAIFVFCMFFSSTASAQVRTKEWCINRLDDFISNDMTYVMDNLGDCLSYFTCSDFTADPCRYYKDNGELPFIEERFGGLFGETPGPYLAGYFKNQGECIQQMKEDYSETLDFLGCD